VMFGFVFVGGVVYSSFEPLVRADSLVVVNGRVAYVGSEDKALRIADTLGLKVIDLKGRVVMPGFIDSHAHLDSLGISLNSLDLRGVDSIEKLKRRLREYADRVRLAGSMDVVGIRNYLGRVGGRAGSTWTP